MKSKTEETPEVETINEAPPVAEVPESAFLPEEAPKGKFARVKTADLAALRHLQGPEPSKGMIKTVAIVGVFTPVILFQDSKGYKVGDGIRRIKAAIAADNKINETVPAMVYTDDKDFRHALTIISNTQRSANPLAEVRAINALLEKEYTVDKIAEETTMSPQRIKQRLQLNELHEVLHKAMYAGKIAVSLCDKICKLPMKFQAKLAKIFEDKGELKLADYRHVKDVRQKAALSEVENADPEVFGATKAERQDGLSNLERNLLNAFRKRRTLIGKKHAAAAKELDRQIVSLETELAAAEETRAATAAA